MKLKILFKKLKKKRDKTRYYTYCSRILERCETWKARALIYNRELFKDYNSYIITFFDDLINNAFKSVCDTVNYDYLPHDKAKNACMIYNSLIRNMNIIDYNINEAFPDKREKYKNINWSLVPFVSVKDALRDEYVGYIWNVDLDTNTFYGRFYNEDGEMMDYVNVDNTYLVTPIEHYSQANRYINLYMKSMKYNSVDVQVKEYNSLMDKWALQESYLISFNQQK